MTLFFVLFFCSFFEAPLASMLFTFPITILFTVIMSIAITLFVIKERRGQSFDTFLLLPLIAAPVVAASLALLGESVMSRKDASFLSWPPIPNIGQYESILRQVPMTIVMLTAVFCICSYFLRKESQRQALLVYICELYFLLMMALSANTLGVPMTLWP